MNTYIVCQQSGNVAGRSISRPLLLLVCLWVLGFSPVVWGDPDESPQLLVYLADSGRPEINRQVSLLLQKKLGERLTIRALQQGQSIQDRDNPIITIGSEALTRVRQENRNTPIISLLAKPGLLESYSKQSGGDVSGVYRGSPLLHQALAGKAILPHSSRIAMLATPDSAVLYEPLIDQLGAHGMEGRIFIVSEQNDLIRTLTRALNYGDFLLAAPDSDIYNPRTIKHVLLTAYRRNRIVIGPDQAYVGAGSLASVYAPLEAMTDKVAEFVVSYRQQGRLPPPVYPDRFSVSVNRQVAQSLNIPVPGNEQIIDDIRTMTRADGDRDDE